MKFFKFISNAVLSLGVLTMVFSSVALVAPVQAQLLPDSNDLCPAEGCPLGIDDTSTNANRDDIAGVIIDVAQFITFLVGALSVLFIVIGGLFYATDGGGGKRAESGKKMAVNAVIGLVLAVAAYGIVAILGSVLQGDLLGEIGS